MLFFVFWVILNGRITTEVVVIGLVVACLMSLLFYRFIGLNPATEKKLLRKAFAVAAYVYALIIEMIKANVLMIKILLSPVIETQPQIKYFESPVRSDIAKVALATSINLTPGTILIELEDNRFGVHAIDASMLADIDYTWSLVQKLREIEEGH
ncbi:MAG: Na+/H+ antiporter subunit E [Defluviitaleaceae bacterium]|nr:Na+/H+ antiporter subunit E [Defluviitaleaceae bacterium]